MKKILLSFLTVSMFFIFSCGGGSGKHSTGNNQVYITASFIQQHIFIAPEITTLRYSVTGLGMEPVTGMVPVTSSTVDIDLSVQNGPDRYFLIKALDDSNTVIYKGSATRNLTGTPVIIDIELKGTECAFTQLTTDPASDAHPYWSPDSMKIVFHSDRSGNNDIWVMNADGSSQTQLTTDPAGDRLPHWSPDGAKIVFRSGRSGNQDIWVMDADGSNQTQLTTDPADDSHPNWSPDGTRIAFQSDRSGNKDIWVMNVDGSDKVQITNNPEDDTHPMWGPEGNRIAFSRLVNGDSGNIWIMDADGSNQRQITNDPGNEQHPDWNPFGKSIAFRSDRNGNYDIWAVYLDDLTQEQITTDTAEDVNPDWSLDGKRIVFRSDRSGNKDIWVCDLLEGAPSPEPIPEPIPEPPPTTIIGNWEVHFRCAGVDTDVAVLDIELDETTGGNFSGNGTGTDLNGSQIDMTLDGSYNTTSNFLSGTLTSTFEGSTCVREDVFSTTLLSRDTGYISMTQTQVCGCDGEVRLVKLASQ